MQIISDFLRSIAFTLIRLLFIVGIFAGIYLLCIIHTFTNIWFGIIAFILSLFCIIVGALVTYLFGAYDREVDVDTKEFKE